MDREESTGQEGQQKGRPGLDRDDWILIAGAVAGIILLIVIAAVFILPQETGSSPAAVPAVVKTPTSPATLPGSIAQGSAGQAQDPVDFRLGSGDMTSCGLTCRQLTATIVNTGDATAHGVCITLRMQNSRGDVIGLNGGDALTQCIGDLAGGASKSEPVTINADCGLFAIKCLKETLTMETEVVSTERTVRFPDRVIAV